jgi:hypothetical protein
MLMMQSLAYQEGYLRGNPVVMSGHSCPLKHMTMCQQISIGVMYCAMLPG